MRMVMRSARVVMKRPLVVSRIVAPWFFEAEA